MKLKILIEVGSISFGADLMEWWRFKVERMTKSFVVQIGPLFFIRSNLPFCKKACDQLYKRLENRFSSEAHVEEVDPYINHGEQA